MATASATKIFKKIFAKVGAFFWRQNTWCENTTFTMQLTTNSPPFTIKKHHQICKIPCKRPHRYPLNFFLLNHSDLVETCTYP